MINYRMRLNQILGCTSLITRCAELSSFLESCSVDDLKSYYQLIVDSIFGFPCYMGWGIRRITRNTQAKETEVVLRFLAPDGPLFKAIYRLMNDRNFRLEYPISSLPTVLEQRINRLDIPEFFVKKVHITYDNYGQATVLRNIFLNPLEYYFFLFTYVNLSIGANQNYLMGWGTLIDSLYTNLLDDYLNYFFPCDGRGVPPITSQGRPQSESTFNSDPIIQRNNIATPSRTSTSPPTLFRASIFQECMTVSTPTRDTGFSPSNTYSYLDIWRSETILNVFMEMWTTVDCNDTVSSYFRSSLPSVELVKGVRIMVRHIHYFTNCLNQQALHPMEELKRTVLPQYQKKLYLFLRHLFNRWPLDNTFRIVYETWLSYIQPWRYIKLENIRHREKENFGAKEPNVDISLWAGFLTDNILFYTVIFQQMLPRFLRADLTSQKNALMLFRATKVFSTQESMKAFLVEIESMVMRYLANPEYHPVGAHNFYQSSGSVISGDIGASSSSEYCSPARLANVKQLILELEPANSTYEPLFSDKTKNMVKSAVTAINQAIESLETTSEATAPVKQKSSSFLKFWSDGGNSWIGGGEGDQVSVTDKSRVSQLLNYSKTQLIFLFDLHTADIQSHEFSSIGDENHSTEGMHLTPGEFSPSILSKLTPKGVLTEDMLKPRGNPDLASLKSNETGCLVQFFHSISSRLNQKYGQQIINNYYCRDKWGKYARACFARPVLYPVIEKTIPGRQVKTVRYLPPRVNLRPLASHSSIVCAIIILFLSLIFNYSPWLLIFLAAFFYTCYTGLMGCMEKPEVVDDLIRNFGPYIHNAEESEYYDN